VRACVPAYRPLAFCVCVRERMDGCRTGAGRTCRTDLQDGLAGRCLASSRFGCLDGCSASLRRTSRRRRLTDGPLPTRPQSPETFSDSRKHSAPCVFEAVSLCPRASIQNFFLSPSTHRNRLNFQLQALTIPRGIPPEDPELRRLWSPIDRLLTPFFRLLSRKRS